MGVIRWFVIYIHLVSLRLPWAGWESLAAEDKVMVFLQVSASFLPTSLVLYFGLKQWIESNKG